MNIGIQRTFSLNLLWGILEDHCHRLHGFCWTVSFDPSQISPAAVLGMTMLVLVFSKLLRGVWKSFPCVFQEGKKVSLLSYWNIYLVILLYQVRIKVATFLLVLSKTSGQTRKWKNTQRNKEGALFLERTYCSDIQNSCWYFCCILFCRRFLVRLIILVKYDMRERP